MKGTSRTFVVVLAIATILATIATGAALADKGGRSKGDSSISQPVIVSGSVTESIGSVPRYGDWITFDVSTTETTRPFVNLNCYQDGVLVAQGWAGFFDGALGSQKFGLYSPQWTGGAADCTADLDMYSNGRWAP